MKRMAISALLVLGATAAMMSTAVPAGPVDPFRVRIVTMNGQEGPAYYSRQSGGYRFLAQPADGSRSAAR